MADYLEFAKQMRPLADTILNTLKVKETEVRREVTNAQQSYLASILERQDVWFSLVQLIFSEAQGMVMEDQTLQQAFMLLKSLNLKRNKTQPHLQGISLFEETMSGLTCLMIASKVQDSEMHLRVEDVVQLLRKLLEDNVEMQSCNDIPGGLLRAPSAADEQFRSRRLQNRALLERVASLEKSTINQLRFNLNVATPYEFIVVYLQLFEMYVTQIDWETIMMLKGQSISNSYICLHVAECVLLGAQAIALASLLHVMLDWQWHQVADQFITLTKTESPDSCTFEDVILCSHRLREMIEHQRQATASPNIEVQETECDTEIERTGGHDLLSDEEESKMMLTEHHLTTVNEASDFAEITRLCDIHGETDSLGAGIQNFTDLADSTTLLIQQQQRSEFSFCNIEAGIDRDNTENIDVQDVTSVPVEASSYQIPEALLRFESLPQSCSEIQMLVVVDEQTSETDEVEESSSLPCLQIGLIRTDSLDDNGEVRDASDEKREFKLAESFSQMLPINKDHRSLLEEPIDNSNQHKYHFEQSGTVRISLAKHSSLSPVSVMTRPEAATFEAAVSYESADELADVAEHDQQSSGQHGVKTNYGNLYGTPFDRPGFVDSIISHRHGASSSLLMKKNKQEFYESCELLRATHLTSAMMTDQAMQQAALELNDVADEILPMASRNSPKLTRQSLFMTNNSGGPPKGMFTRIKGAKLHLEADQNQMENTHPNSDVKQEAEIGRACLATLTKVKHDMRHQRKQQATTAGIADCDVLSQESSSPLKMSRRMLRYTFGEASFLSLKRTVVPTNNFDMPQIQLDGSPDFNHGLGLSRPLSNSNSRESGLIIRTKLCSQQSAVWTNQNQSFKSSLVSSGTMMGPIQPPYASTQRRPCQPMLVTSVISSLLGTAEKASRSGKASENDSNGKLVSTLSMRQLRIDSKLSEPTPAFPQYSATEKDEIRQPIGVRVPPKHPRKKTTVTNQKHPLSNRNYATTTSFQRTNSRPFAELCPNGKVKKQAIGQTQTGKYNKRASAVPTSSVSKTQLQQYQAANCGPSATRVDRTTALNQNSNNSYQQAQNSLSGTDQQPQRQRKAVRSRLL